jgi:hypothetical protein
VDHATADGGGGPAPLKGRAVDHRVGNEHNGDRRAGPERGGDVRATAMCEHRRVRKPVASSIRVQIQVLGARVEDRVRGWFGFEAWQTGETAVQGGPARRPRCQVVFGRAVNRGHLVRPVMAAGARSGQNSERRPRSLDEARLPRRA